MQLTVPPSLPPTPPTHKTSALTLHAEFYLQFYSLRGFLGSFASPLRVRFMLYRVRRPLDVCSYMTGSSYTRVFHGKVTLFTFLPVSHWSSLTNQLNTQPSNSNEMLAEPKLSSKKQAVIHTWKFEINWALEISKRLRPYNPKWSFDGWA